MKRLLLVIMVGVSLVPPVSVLAQDAAEPRGDNSRADSPQGDTLSTTETPVAATDEQGVKPTRRFFPALGHNLFDDIKHLPTWGTVAWLASGGAGALAIHPEASEINGELAAVAARFQV